MKLLRGEINKDRNVADQMLKKCKRLELMNVSPHVTPGTCQSTRKKKGGGGDLKKNQEDVSVTYSI